MSQATATTESFASLPPPTTTESYSANSELTSEATSEILPLSDKTLLSTMPVSSVITNGIREHLVSSSIADQSVASTIPFTSHASTQAEQRTSVLARHVTAQPLSASVTNVWDLIQHASSIEAVVYADNATQRTDTFPPLKENASTSERSVATEFVNQHDGFVPSVTSPNSSWNLNFSGSSTETLSQATYTTESFASLPPPTKTESYSSNSELTSEANAEILPLSDKTLLSTMPVSSVITNDIRATSTSQPLPATPNGDIFPSLPSTSVAAELETRTSSSEAAVTASTETGSMWSHMSSTTMSISNSTIDVISEKPIDALIQKAPGSTVKIYRITCGESGVYAAGTDGNVYYRNSTHANAGAVGDTWLNYGKFTVWNVTAIVSTKFSCLVYTSDSSFLRFYGSFSWRIDDVYFNSSFLAINNPNTATFFGVTVNMTLAAGFRTCPSCSATWTVCDTGGLSAITFGAAGLWAITKKGALYYLNNSREAEAKCSEEWIKMDGQFLKVAAGKQLVLAIATNGTLYARTGLSGRNPIGSHWVSIRVGVSITDIAVSTTDLAWFVSDVGETYTIKNLQTLL